ncbi:hypothetical protein IT398_00045 [Candidatus Nomurabacteria bacterium]|nr:hypothetical protein [Candidatus Nomurabacteria bacterium]
MPILVLPFNYLVWHYTVAWGDLSRIYRDFLWFIYHFFSLPVLLKTLFSPWRRLGEAYPGRFNLSEIFASFFINTFMRLIGFLIRFLLVVFGTFVLFISMLIGFAVFIVWFALPFIVVASLLLGIKLLL